MKFEKPNCPECGELAKGTEDTIPGTALMSLDEETGEFEYDGETDIFWDGQERITNKACEVKLSCPQGHCWFSRMLED